MATAGRASAQSGEHRWAGIVVDAFAWDTGSGIEAWTVEDGGRIRHRDPSSGEWAFQDVPAAVKDTLHRVTFLTSGTYAGEMGWAVGQGGWVLKTTDGGSSYDIDFEVHGSQDVVGEPHRTHSLYFDSYTDGWQGGQLFRIAFSANEGVTWEEQEPSPTASNDKKCLAIAFDSVGELGVAVGEAFTDPVSDSTQPMIRYTDDGGGTQWLDNVTVLAAPAYLDNDLVEATWVADETFWAVGYGGLILYTENGGASWRQFLPDGPSDPDQLHFDLEGVTFLDASNGVFVGLRPDPVPNGALAGTAYHYQAGDPPDWNEIAMPSLPSGEAIIGLYDVAWGETQSATSIWAVGEKSVDGVTQGVVLRADWSGSSFGAFAEVNEGGFPDCRTGGELAESKVLTEVEVAPVTGDVWVGGKCGRVWVGRAASTSWSQWDPVKSATSAHVTDISFVVDSQTEPVGYVNGFRTGPLQQCIVRVRD